MRSIKHGWYAIEDDSNLSDRRGTGSARPPTPYILPPVIFEFLGSVNWAGKSERRAECLYLQPIRASSSADILSQLTDRVRRALVASAPRVRRGVRAVNQVHPGGSRSPWGTPPHASTSQPSKARRSSPRRQEGRGNLSTHTGANAATTAAPNRPFANLSAVLPSAAPAKANNDRSDGTGRRALQQTLQRFSLKDRRYLHRISFRPTCFEARPRTPGRVPVQLELKTERFGMAYRLSLPLRFCPSEI